MQDFDKERLAMVEAIKEPARIKDKRVISALKKVPRHLFVPEREILRAYECSTLPGDGSYEFWSVSDPACVAFMCQSLNLKGQENVLDVGGGSGYHAAILGQLVRKVTSIERISSLVERASKVCTELNYKNIEFKIGDAHNGYKEAAPYDAINIACSTPSIPKELLNQLAPNGRIIIPLENKDGCNLVLIRKLMDRTIKSTILSKASFVPMRSGTA